MSGSLPPGAGPEVGLLLALRLLSELALFGVLAAVGLEVAGVAGAVLLALAGVAVWAVLVAPRSARRLPDPGRLAVEVGLFTVAGIGCAAVVSMPTGVVLAGGGAGCATAVRRWAPGA